MTPNELREKRKDIIKGYFIDQWGDSDLDEMCERLEVLDREALPQDTFYDPVNEMDGYRKLLSAAQGNPARIVMVLDMINALCVRHAEKLEKEIAK